MPFGRNSKHYRNSGEGEITLISLDVSSAYILVYTTEDICMHASCVYFRRLLQFCGHRKTSFFTLSIAGYS